MRRLWIIALFVTILSIPVSFLRAEEDYIYVEQRDPVTGKTEIKKMKNVFTETTKVPRHEQVLRETAEGMMEGAATMNAGGLVAGTVKGALKGATEPPEYSTFDKTKINSELRKEWSNEGLQPGQPGYLSEEEKKQAYEQATQQRAEE